MHIREFVQHEYDAWQKLGGCDYMRAFLLECGEEYIGAKPTTKRGTPKQCFANAGDMALYSPHLTYCEGLAWRPNGIPIAIHHAWLVTDDGTVVDPTWQDCGDCEYLGVTVDKETLRSRILETKMWGVLDYGSGFCYRWVSSVWSWTPPLQSQT